MWLWFLASCSRSPPPEAEAALYLYPREAWVKVGQEQRFEVDAFLGEAEHPDWGDPSRLTAVAPAGGGDVLFDAEAAPSHFVFRAGYEPGDYVVRYTMASGLAEEAVVHVAYAEDLAAPVLPPLWEVGGHAGGFTITAGAISPDGRRAATASLDGTLRLWDAGTGALLAVQDLGADQPTALCFDPAGERLASAEDGFQTTGRVRILEGDDLLERGDHLFHPALIPASDTPAGCAWGPDGSFVAVVVQRDYTELSETDVSFVSVVAPRGDVRAVVEREGEWNGRLQLDPTGARARISPSEGSPWVVDLATGAVLADEAGDWSSGPLASADGAASLAVPDCVDAAWCPVSFVRGDQTVTTDGPWEDLTAAAWSPDGAWLAVLGSNGLGGAGPLRVFDADDGSVAAEVARAPSDGSAALAWSPDGGLLVAASGPRAWSTADWAPVDLALPDYRGHAAFVPGYDRTLAWSSAGAVVVTDLVNRETLGEFAGISQDVGWLHPRAAFAPLPRVFAADNPVPWFYPSGDPSWSAGPGESVLRLQSGLLEWRGLATNALWARFPAEGADRVAREGGVDGTVIWGAADVAQSMWWVEPHRAWRSDPVKGAPGGLEVRFVTLSPDGSRVAVGGTAFLRVYSVDDWRGFGP